MYLLRYAPDNASLVIRLMLQVAGLQRRSALVDQAVAGMPGLFAPDGIIAPYMDWLMRWSVLYPQGQRPRFMPRNDPVLHLMAARLQGRTAPQPLIRAEGLGASPFTARRPPTPAEGSAT